MAERIVGLEEERKVILEAARWRAQQIADLRMQVLNSIALRVQK